jgi:hypothetical protein
MAKSNNQNDLERLHKSLEEGFRITGKRISIKPKTGKNLAEVTLKKGQEELRIKSLQKSSFGMLFIFIVYLM